MSEGPINPWDYIPDEDGDGERQSNESGPIYNYNENDPWDVYLADLTRYKILRGLSRHDEERRAEILGSDKECFACEIDEEMFRDGEDGLSTETPGDGEWMVDDLNLDEIVKPEFIKEHLDGEYRVQLQHLIGMYRKDTDGRFFVARLWDQQTNTEIPGSRFFGDKLSQAATAAMSKMPEYGTEIFVKKAEHLAYELHILASHLVREIDGDEENNFSFKKVDLDNSEQLEELVGYNLDFGLISKAGSTYAWINAESLKIENESLGDEAVEVEKMEKLIDRLAQLAEDLSDCLIQRNLLNVDDVPEAGERPDEGEEDDKEDWQK